MSVMTRRQWLSRCSAGGLTASVLAPVISGAAENISHRPLRILVTGAHPGDPEAGCGGTIARYVKQGESVAALYLTRGEAGISGRSARDAAQIRTAEALAACGILGASAVFAEQIDGATETNPARLAEFGRLIKTAEPEVVFTHWPIDSHPDHRNCASLTLGAWNALGRKFALYFYEVDLGSDTQCFRPDCYVDVQAVEKLKRDACMAHRSQDPQQFYVKDHVPMMRFRGMECGRPLAEAFIHHDQSPEGRLPGSL